MEHDDDTRFELTILTPSRALPARKVRRGRPGPARPSGGICQKVMINSSWQGFPGGDGYGTRARRRCTGPGTVYKD